ncbi:transcription regulator, AsnC family 6 [Thermococcus cleftensis]|uniref:Transcription regulator, AsnC family 6 n=1 Tax=Thermococcus cleftensis (strain DSM 27260 / KACC 17922 / CL1) TaxID=163003 RepID=I3ZV51_THECF|nr:MULTISPECIES: Lrp/AsnC family transcriptional regulator [Thermococcus]AFL95585.1 transcription regulator, AsnC family 6 [Thermococcus cleftensis]NJE04372.1 Lrp/AsnC family transcriptional regulator [Thermococcus sp. MV11]
MRTGLDETDRKILAILQKNSRTPLREISKEVGLAESTVYERIKKLKDRGIIRKFTVILDPESLGFKILAFILIKSKAGMYSHVANELKQYPQIVEIYETTGDYDMLVKIRTSGSDELNEFLDTIGEIDGVVATHTMVALKIHKETTELPL